MGQLLIQLILKKGFGTVPAFITHMIIRNFSAMKRSGRRWAVGCFIGVSVIVHAAPVRNVILCIGDGMGPEEIKAARLYAGGDLFFESFPFQGSISTESSSSLVTDSAASASAMATGQKVNNGVVSLALPGDGRELQTALEYFQTKEKSVGLVTTAYMTHATPAAFGAHVTSRYYTSQIANDYMTQTRPQVLFGGGANGMSVINAENAGYSVVTDRAALFSLAPDQVEYVSGQFGTTHLPYEYDGLGDLPRLPEMTTVALGILENDPDGFFLMVEGGRIDHAGHASDLPRNIGETLAFAETVETIYNWAAGRADTLILVTADHETGGLTVTADNGPGVYPDVIWSSDGNHTAAPVPVYAWGKNADLAETISENTDIYQIVTSNVMVPNLVVSVEAASNGRSIVWAATVGETYRVESTPSLAPPSWQTLKTVIATNFSMSVLDTNEVSMCFYRLTSLGNL